MTKAKAAAAAMAAVLVAVFVIPTPTANTFTTGIQMVADKPEVEVYGPALPSLIVQGYTRENTGSIIVDEVQSDVHYVYAADGADCYHEYECKFAFASSQRLTVLSETNSLSPSSFWVMPLAFRRAAIKLPMVFFSMGVPPRVCFLA